MLALACSSTKPRTANATPSRTSPNLHCAKLQQTCHSADHYTILSHLFIASYHQIKDHGPTPLATTKDQRYWQVQCEDGEEYKRTLKLQLKALLDGPGLRDSLNGLSEFVVLLVRAPGSDAAAKAPRKVSPPCQKRRGGGYGWGAYLHAAGPECCRRALHEC